MTSECCSPNGGPPSSRGLRHCVTRDGQLTTPPHAHGEDDEDQEQHLLALLHQWEELSCAQTQVNNDLSDVIISG